MTSLEPVIDGGLNKAGFLKWHQAHGQITPSFEERFANIVASQPEIVAHQAYYTLADEPRSMILVVCNKRP